MTEFRAESNRMCSVFVAAMLLGAVPAVDATTIHVPGDYPSIGAALDAAGDGDEVRVGPGTYKENWLSFSGKDIRLRSTAGYASTVINAQRGGPGFYFDGLEDNGACVDGFTVTNGKNAEGGAIVTGSTHIEVLNCRFIGNEATDRAGAWHHEAYGGLPYFRNCQFEDNASPKHGGAGYVKYGSAILEDCVFRENYCSWSGSGIYATGDARLLMLNCTFEDNFGSPVISAGGAALLVIDRCRIADNDGTGVYAPDAFLLRDSEISGNTTDVTGGGLHMDAGTVIRSKIANNVSDSDGGGVTIYNGCATFDDCVISGNRAEEDGGGIYCSGSNCPTFTDCVIEANESYSGGGAYCSRESAATFTHCNISGNYAKVGAGVTCDSSDVSFPKLEGCEVISNIGSSGGGLLVLRSDPDISNTVIAGNVGSIAGGGVWMLESNARLDNVTLSENQAGLGGGIYSALSSPVV